MGLISSFEDGLRGMSQTMEFPAGMQATFRVLAFASNAPCRFE
jgi:hypothetical protein